MSTNKLSWSQENEEELNTLKTSWSAFYQILSHYSKEELIFREKELISQIGEFNPRKNSFLRMCTLLILKKSIKSENSKKFSTDFQRGINFERKRFIKVIEGIINGSIVETETTETETETETTETTATETTATETTATETTTKETTATETTTKETTTKETTATETTTKETTATEITDKDPRYEEIDFDFLENFNNCGRNAQFSNIAFSPDSIFEN